MTVNEQTTTSRRNAKEQLQFILLRYFEKYDKQTLLRMATQLCLLIPEERISCPDITKEIISIIGVLEKLDKIQDQLLEKRLKDAFAENESLRAKIAAIEHSGLEELNRCKEDFKLTLFAQSSELYRLREQLSVILSESGELK
jgi:hypothetical protein